jgi:PAT family beta-lactamase induction signal transducer AmpG
MGMLLATATLGYWWAASAAPSKPLMLLAALFENFAAGMGTAAFVAFLMSVCEPRFAASQYALLSALVALSRAIAGPVAGALAQRLGYAPFFLVAFCLTLPGFALLPFLRRAAAPPDEVSATSS